MNLKKILKIIRDIIEVYIPLIAFSIMFIVFILQIFYRYVLNQPLTWPYELTLFGFIWTVILGGIFARRMNNHVSFTLVYDSLKPKKKTISRIIGNIMILIGFAFALYPCYDYIQFMSYQKSTVLRIPFNIAFFPFVIFLIFIIGYSLYDIVIDIKSLFKASNSAKADDKTTGGDF